jgi:predicted permease
MRHAVRSLIRQPGFSFTVAGTLTVALAFVIASAGILDRLLLHPYDYPRLRKLLLVRDSKPREGAHQGRSIAVADFLDARRSVPAFAALAGWRPEALVVTSAGAEPERIEGAAVSANFFTTLGVVPVLGRAFASDADTAGRDRVVVLSRRLWTARFGADPSLVGRDIGLNGRTTMVAGVIRDEDCYPPGIDAWIPLVFAPSELNERAGQRVAAIGRVADGSNDGEAAGQLAALAQALAARYPDTNRGRGFDVLPVQREQYEFTAPLFLFVLAAAMLVLALATVNVTNVLIARTLDRRRELAVRAMLGATGGRVACVAIAEVVLLTAAAIIVSVLAAGGVLNGVRASLPEGIARWVAGWSSLRVNGAAVVAGCATGLLVALVISVLVGVASVRASRNAGVDARATRRSAWSRRLLVAGEVSVAAALMLGAAVMVAGFNQISAAFEALAPARVLRFTLTLPESRYPDATRISAFHKNLLDRLRASPEVENAALIRNEPASNVPNPYVAFRRDDLPPIQPSDMPRIDVEVVSPAVFELLRLELLDGRALSAADEMDAARVGVISQTARRRFWPDRSPVGTTIRVGADRQPMRLVGVVSDLTLNWYDPQPRPTLFVPDAQSPARTTSVLVRTRRDPMSLARSMRATVAQLDDRQPLSSLEPLSTTIADSLSPIQVIERLLVVGSFLAAALAALGIYGVFGQWVAARQREIGVRFALGATRATIAWFVLRDALAAAGAGIAAGVAAAALIIRVAADALLGVPKLDLTAPLVVAVCTIALTIAGSVGPARRAASVDIAELLRLE